jgi:hypothetical protein
MPIHPARLFTLRVRLTDNSLVTINAEEEMAPQFGPQPRILVEVIHKGQPVFPLGALWCSLAPASRATIDGLEARSLVLSLVAMRPGDTDSEYFSMYTAAQREWAEAHGEYLTMVAEERYGADAI